MLLLYLDYKYNSYYSCSIIVIQSLIDQLWVSAPWLGGSTDSDWLSWLL